MHARWRMVGGLALCVSTQKPSVHSHTHSHTYTLTHSHIHSLTHTHTHTHTRTHTHTHLCTHTHAHTHSHTSFLQGSRAFRSKCPHYRGAKVQRCGTHPRTKGTGQRWPLSQPRASCGIVTHPTHNTHNTHTTHTTYTHDTQHTHTHNTQL
jgi:hypothetical protein